MAVHVLLPPSWSPSRDWLAAHVCTIELQEPVEARLTPSVVTTLGDGKRFSGFPMRPVWEGPAGPMSLLADYV